MAKAQRKPRAIRPAKTPERQIDVSEMRQTWLEQYIETGDAEEAARIARYAAPAESARQLKYKLKHQIEEACAERIGSRTPMYLHQLETLAESAKSEQVKFAALRDLLDRGKALRGQRIVVDRFDHMSQSELWDKLVDAMGYDKALAFMGPDFVPPSDDKPTVN